MSAMICKVCGGDASDGEYDLYDLTLPEDGDGRVVEKVTYGRYCRIHRRESHLDTSLTIDERRERRASWKAPSPVEFSVPPQKVVVGKAVGVRLCQALGLPPKKVRKIIIEADNRGVIAKIDWLVDGEDAERIVGLNLTLDTEGAE